MRARIVAVVFILALPLFFYFFITGGKHSYRHLQILGPKRSVSKTDTIYHTIRDFNFIDANGKTVSFKEYNPAYWVFSFFNTQCKSQCLDVMANLQEEIQRKYKDIDKVKVLSITTQPFNDSLPLLKNFAAKNGITSDKWLVCTGDSLQIDSLMQYSFFMKADKNNYALQAIFLVDPDKRIRGMYDGTDVMEVKKLKDEIRVLSYEYKQKQKK